MPSPSPCSHEETIRRANRQTREMLERKIREQKRDFERCGNRTDNYTYSYQIHTYIQVHLYTAFM